jgi:hypothetical protein
MATSPKLALPFLEAGQAQKHVTVNETLRMLDAVVQASVESATVAAPPGSPVNGAAYIVPTGATGAWAGWSGSIAFWADTAWLRLVPVEGWMAWVRDADQMLMFDSAAWVDAGTQLGALDIAFLVPPAGEYIQATTGTAGTTTSTLAGAANRMDIYPFTPRADISVDRLAVNVTTAVASALGKIVVFGSDAKGRPDAKLAETADLDFSTTGVKDGTVALTLRKGRTYWLGIRHSSTATLSAWDTRASADINGGSPVTTARKTLRRTLTYATAAPAAWVFVSSEINTAAATAIWLRVA